MEMAAGYLKEKIVLLYKSAYYCIGKGLEDYPSLITSALQPLPSEPIFNFNFTENTAELF